MSIATVIVTYNRLTLLKECLEAVRAQSLKSDKIIIVNNNSTDGTAEYLSTVDDERVDCVNLEENIGGAGGFSYGMKKAVQEGYDYVWIMDDDSIPQINALCNLSKAFSLADNVGFAASKVIWTDGMPHKMNIAEIKIMSRDYTDIYNTYSREDIPAFLCTYASFVSLLIDTKVIRKIGLPIKEFFIWSDDVEYIERIRNNGYIGLYIDNSVVLHKTPTNYVSKPQFATGAIAWKFYYGARNTTYLKRRHYKKGKLLLWLSLINRYRVFVHRVNKCADKKGIPELKRQFRKGLWDGLSFNPDIEML